MRILGQECPGGTLRMVPGYWIRDLHPLHWRVDDVVELHHDELLAVRRFSIHWDGSSPVNLVPLQRGGP